MVAAGRKVAIRATYRGTDKGGFIPNMPTTGKAFEMEAMYLVRINDQGQIAEHWGVIDTIGTMGQLGLLPPQGLKAPQKWAPTLERLKEKRWAAKLTRPSGVRPRTTGRESPYSR